MQKKKKIIIKKLVGKKCGDAGKNFVNFIVNYIITLKNNDL